jgi:hypothetical protein
MTPREGRPSGSGLRHARWIRALLVSGLMFGGCTLPAPRFANFTPLTPDYEPGNVYSYGTGISPDLKRVAVLPLACEEQRPELQDGCNVLNPILQSELIKTRKFEVVCVSPESLRNRTGRLTWKGSEVMPRQIFDSLREVYGCDAVLFCQVTAFRAYEPLAIGWRMRLVNAQTGQTVWALDEIVDAGQPSVRDGAAHYASAELQSSQEDRGNWRLRNSPRQFGQYAAAQAFATLPTR